MVSIIITVKIYNAVNRYRKIQIGKLRDWLRKNC